MKHCRIGVLALQGDFQKHLDILYSMGIEAVAVRAAKELKGCDGLILPGGESTTIHRHLKESGLDQSILEFSQKKPLFGTCAGLILMAGTLLDEGRVIPMKLIDVDVSRNAYGRQVDSFSAEITLHSDLRHPRSFHAMFIRAPRISRIGHDVTVLAEINGEPVLVRQGRHLGATFHPELTDDTAVHAYFVKIAEEGKLS
jgi:5'-phosphate synthase pdxT subunit